MGDGRPRSPSLWDDFNEPAFMAPPPSPANRLVARNLTISREEIIDSRRAKTDRPSIDYNRNNSYRSELTVPPRSRRPRVVVRKFPLSVIVKRQCAVAPLGPPSLHPTSASIGAWSPAKVMLRISESEASPDQHVETDAWAFNEHDHSPLGADIMDVRSPHLMESSEDPSLFSPGDFGHDHDPWPWCKEEPVDLPDDSPEDLQCPMDLGLGPLDGALVPLGPMPMVPVAPCSTPAHDCYDTESPMSEVVERALLIHGEELAAPSKGIDGGYPCPEKNCQSVLSSLTALRKHRLVHAPKIYACSMCDRAFAERTKLNRHERSHTGEKPYKCPVVGCSKVFAHNFNLNSHLKLHNDERPFVCGVCGKCFAKNSNLRVHAAMHTRPKPQRKRLAITGSRR